MSRIPFLLAIAATVPATAQQSPAPAASPAATAPAADKQICRRIQQVGSIMPFKRVCHTKSQWQVLDGQTNAATQNALDRRGNNQMGSAPSL